MILIGRPAHGHDGGLALTAGVNGRAPVDPEPTSPVDFHEGEEVCRAAAAPTWRCGIAGPASIACPTNLRAGARMHDRPGLVEAAVVVQTLSVHRLVRWHRCPDCILSACQWPARPSAGSRLATVSRNYRHSRGRLARTITTPASPGRGSELRDGQRRRRRAPAVAADRWPDRGRSARFRSAEPGRPGPRPPGHHG